jgi:hypothetical protein
VISGSQAVHFFDRTVPHPDSDLDIYVEHRHVQPLFQFLLDLGEGYTLQLEGDQDLLTTLELIENGCLAFPAQRHYKGKHIAQVYTFIRFDGKRVQVVTTLDAVMAVILQFHSSECLDLICGCI